MECKNCNQALNSQDKFCSSCGQQHISKINVKFVLGEIFQTLFNLDSKAFKSLRFLILKPGFLTKEYVDGRRVSYLPPIRIYIVLSFFFFFFISVFDFSEGDNSATDFSFDFPKKNAIVDKEVSDAEPLAEELTFAVSQESLTSVSELKRMQYEGTLAEGLDSLTAEMSTVEGYIARKVALVQLDDKEFIDVLRDQFSLFLMLFLPFFALLYGLVFRSHKKEFVGNLIFNLHLNSFLLFIFLLDFFIAPILANYDTVNTIWSTILILYVQYYIIKAIMVFYQRKWWVALYKYLFLWIGYAVLAIVFFVVIAFSSILML